MSPGFFSFYLINGVKHKRMDNSGFSCQLYLLTSKKKKRKSCEIIIIIPAAFGCCTCLFFKEPNLLQPFVAGPFVQAVKTLPTFLTMAM